MKNLQPTLTGKAPALQVASILQCLETQRASGTFAMGQDWLRLREGAVVKASADPLDTVKSLLRGRGEFTFRQVRGEPQGSVRSGITALLLNAAREDDETRRAS